MEGKAVPRPDPPRYAPLWQGVHRFLAGLGSLERMTSLLGRLMVHMLTLLCVCDSQVLTSSGSAVGNLTNHFHVHCPCLVSMPILNMDAPKTL